MNIWRRGFVNSILFGSLSVTTSRLMYIKSGSWQTMQQAPTLFHRYPAIDDTVVEEVVGASHFDPEKVKRLVDRRPELARATWDWGFGDWETALGAASHVGRRDIVEYLLDMGARPDIFTFAMLGKVDAVRTMVEAQPGVQRIPGPHGISLLDHVHAGHRWEGLTKVEKNDFEMLLEYLQAMQGDHSSQPPKLSAEQQAMYLGDYIYGPGEEDGFSVRLNMRKLLALGKLGKFGGALYPTEEPHTFRYNGVESVRIRFDVEDDHVLSLTITEPDLVLKAMKS